MSKICFTQPRNHLLENKQLVAPGKMGIANISLSTKMVVQPRMIDQFVFQHSYVFVSHRQ